MTKLNLPQVAGVGERHRESKLGRGTCVSQVEDTGQSQVQEGAPRTPRDSEQCYRLEGEPGGQTGHENAARTPVLFLSSDWGQMEETDFCWERL